MDTSYPPWPVKHLPFVPDRDYEAYPYLYYRYQKLETSSSFRLLKFERITDDPKGRSYYSLIHTTFDQAPVYETLSYVWGTIHRDVSISMRNGKLLRITEPLKDALSIIEEQCETGFIWIDQICIDQDDTAERGHQVKVMGRIYSSCTRVIVWLGRCEEQHTSVLDVKNTGAHELSRSRSRSPLRRLENHLRGFRKHSKMPPSRIDDERLSSLQSPWFQRAWVFQEIVLPPNAHFVMLIQGANKVLTMAMSTLYGLIEQAGWLNINELSINAALNMFERWKERQSNDANLYVPIEEQLSLLTPQARASEYLDILYAFLGLNMNSNIRFSPAYNISFNTALFETALSIIQGTRSLDILELVNRDRAHHQHRKDPYERKSYMDQIPSWCPDFRQAQFARPFKRSTIDFNEFLSHQSRKTWCPRLLYENGRAVAFHGFGLDVVYAEIGALSAVGLSEVYFQSLLASATEAWGKAKSAYNYDGNDVELWEHTAKPIKLEFADSPTMKTLCLALAAGTLPVGFDFEDSPVSLELKHVIQKHGNEPLEVMKGRALWVTRSGRLAVGRFTHDSMILLAYGCSNPISLFNTSWYNYTYTQGTCFLEGWMDPWSNGKIEELEESATCTIGYIF